MINLLFSILILIIFVVGGIWCKKQENIQWNNGSCLKCHKGFYKSFDMDSSGAVGYSCTNCGDTTWQSHNTR